MNQTQKQIHGQKSHSLDYLADKKIEYDGRTDGRTNATVIISHRKIQTDNSLRFEREESSLNLELISSRAGTEKRRKRVVLLHNNFKLIFFNKKKVKRT